MTEVLTLKDLYVQEQHEQGWPPEPLADALRREHDKRKAWEEVPAETACWTDEGVFSGWVPLKVAKGAGSATSEHSFDHDCVIVGYAVRDRAGRVTKVCEHQAEAVRGATFFVINWSPSSLL